MSSLLSESTYTVVLQCSKLRAEINSIILGFACDRLIVTATLFYRPCTRFTPSGHCFRTTKMGLCLPEWTKAFSRHSSRKKMLTPYSIVLQSLAHSIGLLLVMSAV